MKFLNTKFLLFLTINIAVKINAFEFEKLLEVFSVVFKTPLDLVFDIDELVQKKEKQFSDLRFAIEKLQTEYEKKIMVMDVSSLNSTIDTVNDSHGKTAQVLKGLCDSNRKTYNEYRRFLISPNDHFSGLDDELTSRLRFVNKIINNTSVAILQVSKDINETQKTIGSAFDELLLSLERKFKDVADHKNNSLRDRVARDKSDINIHKNPYYASLGLLNAHLPSLIKLWKDSNDVKLAETEKYELEQKIKAVNQILSKVEMYVQRIQKVKQNLDKMSQDIAGDIINLKKVLTSKQKWLNRIKSIPADYLSFEEKDDYLNELDNTVKDITERSCWLLEKTKLAIIA